MSLISITEYAEKYSKNRKSVQKKAARGGFKTARKIGTQWVIDSEEVFVDNRIKSGKCNNWRKSK